MSGKYLPDTNIAIALFADDSALVGKIAKTEDIFVSAVVIGELFYGASKSGRPKKNSEFFAYRCSATQLSVIMPAGIAVE